MTLSAVHRSWSAVVHDYFTLTKPSIMLLLLVTTVPAMVLAQGGWPGTWLVLATLVGGVLASGGAGAVNMYIDRDIDAIMKRTRRRPIPRGTVSPRAAAIFGWTLGLASGPWLFFTVNALSAALGLAAFLFYVGPYSLYLKRRTLHNTVLGGVAGAIPPLIGWVAVRNEVTIEGVMLFAIVFWWQPAHFWALALDLEEDYRTANIPMMPVVLGAAETTQQMVLYAAATWMVTLIFGAEAHLSWIYFAVAAFGGAGFLRCAVRIYRAEGKAGTRAMFRYSTLYLAALFASMVFDRLLLG
ncbi:MAG: heme o synthase [Dehalococcoidia bacterium]